MIFDSVNATGVTVMPLCQGRPNGRCPDARNDSTVRGTQGDLMLCKNCEDFCAPRNKLPSSSGAAQAVSREPEPDKRSFTPKVYTLTVTCVDSSVSYNKMICNDVLAYVNL